MSDAKQVNHSQKDKKGKGSSTPLPAFNIENMKAMQEVSTVEHVTPGVVIITKKRKFTPEVQESAEQSGKMCKVLESPVPCFCCKRHGLPCFQSSASQRNGGKPPRSLISKGNSSSTQQARASSPGRKEPQPQQTQEQRQDYQAPDHHMQMSGNNDTPTPAKKKPCFNCGETGHFIRHCRKPRRFIRPHTSRGGILVQKLSESRLYLPGIAQCAICGNLDHQEEDCHRINTQCFRCEQYGHCTTNCPTRCWSARELQCYIFDKRHEDEALSIRMRRWSLA